MGKNSFQKIHIVGASAGSGKTYDLCQRYYKKIGDEGIAPGQIIATTYTRKAAAELIQRLRKKLLEEGNVKGALAVEDGRIGTIHSVCLELLADLAFIDGLSPECEILPNDTENWAFTHATDHIVAKYWEDHAEMFYRMGMDQEVWRKTVKQIVTLARGNKIPSKQLTEHAEQCKTSFADMLPKMSAQYGNIAALDEQITPRIKEFLPRLKAALTKYREAHPLEPGKRNSVSGAEKTRDALDQWNPAGRHTWLDYWNWTELGLSNIKEINPLKDDLEGIKALARQHTLTDEFRADIPTCIEISFECAQKAMDCFQNWKKEQGLFDYTDLETMTEELLSGDKRSEVEAALKGRIREIFVDEFQDTSPIQLQIFLALNEFVEKSTWIGDTKQAIYGFRGTAPELMHAAANHIIEQSGSSSSLEDSWRSRPSLVNFTNTLFSAAFAHETNVKLTPQRQEDTPGQTLRMGVVAKKTITIKNGQQRAIDDWSSLAEEVRSLVGKEQITDPQTGKTRPAGHKDIAILCRKNSDCNTVAKALTQLGIPVQMAPKGMERDPQARLCLAAYYYAIHTHAVLPLLEMARLLGADGAARNTPWLQEVIDEPQNLKTLPCLKETLPELDELSTRLPTLSPSGALQQIVHILDQRVSLAADATAHRLLDKAIAYENGCVAQKTCITHEGCLDFLNNEEFEENFEDSTKDAVSVLTYHGSKGLEWPVVMLASLDKLEEGHKKLYFEPKNIPLDENAFDIKSPLKNRKIHYWPWPYGGRETLYQKKANKEIINPEDLQIGESDVAMRIKQNLLQEELRLLYVGMTRARDVLYLVYKTTNDGPSDKWISGVLQGVTWMLPNCGKTSADESPCFTINDATIPCTVVHFKGADEREESPDVEETSDATPVERPARPAGEAPAWPPRAFMPSTLPAAKTADAPKLQKEDIFPIKATAIEGEEDDNDEGSGQHLRNDGKRGTLYHAWLAQAVLLEDEKAIKKRAEAFVEQWKAYAKQWKVTLPKADALVALRQNLLEGLDNLATAKGLTGDPLFRAEWPIAFTRTSDVQLGKKGKTQQVESVVSGFIDLLAIYDNGTVIVDHKFKTAAKTTAESAAKEYASQLEAYREALTKVDGFGDNILCCLHMPVQGKLVVVPHD